MNLLSSHRLSAVAAAILFAVFSNTAFAQQTAPAPIPAAPAAKEDAIVLSPFEVTSEQFNGYEAVNTNSLTGTRTELKRIPITAEVIGQQFLDDIGATNAMEALLEFTAGVGAAIQGSGSESTGQLAGDIINLGQTNELVLRGVRGAGARIDGVVESNDGFLDRVGIETVEVIRGPQSLLFGSNAGAGLVNFVTKKANFGRNRNQVRLQTDSEGSLRGEVDFNRVLGKSFSLRLGGVKENEHNWRDFVGSRTEGAFLALAARLGPRVTLRSFHQNLVKNYDLPDPGVDATLPSTGQVGNLRLFLADGRSPEILNGRIGWHNVDSIWGRTIKRYWTQRFDEATLDLNLAPWLYGRISAAHSDSTVRQGRSQASNSLRLDNDPTSRTYREWIVTSRQRPSFTNSTDTGLRASLSANFSLFKDRVKNEFVLGAEHKRKVFEFHGQEYYRVDAGGQFVQPLAFATETWSVTDSFTAKNPLPEFPKVISYVGGDGFTYKLGDANATDTIDTAEAAFAVLSSDWFDGKLNTFGGLRHDRLKQEFINPANAPYDIGKSTYNAGFVYQLLRGVGVYAGHSISFIPNNQFRVTVDKNTLPASQGKGVEGGLKLDLPFWNISGSVAAFRLQSNAAVFFTAVQRNLVDNDSIFNGRSSPARDLAFISDNKTDGFETTISMRPTKNIRIRISHSHIRSIGGDGFAPARFYNDKIHTNAAGQVIFNGDSSQVVFVNQNPNDVNSARVPLTLGMLNDASSPYGVRFNANNFRIATFGAIALSGVNGIRVYDTAAATVATRGVIGRTDGKTIATGVTGLPWSQNQFTLNPFGNTVVVQAPGEETTGYSEDSMNFNGVYTFTESRLKGLRVGGGFTYNHNVRDYYYLSPTGQRTLFLSPNRLSTNLMIGYTRKLARGISWSVQLNVSNVFDAQSTIFLPNAATGVIDNARLAQNPRLFRLSTTFDF